MYTLAPASCLAVLVSLMNPGRGSPVEERGMPICRKTKVAVLGAGMTGIIAAQTLHNNSIDDFIIVEYNSEIGGRAKHTNFGKDASSPAGAANPIWTLMQKYGVKNTYSNYSSILIYNKSGYTDYSDLLDSYEDAYATVEQDAGRIVSQNLQDNTMRTALSLAGWKPKKNMNQQAAEWWDFDFEYAYPPSLSSETFAIVNYNTSYYQWSEDNNFVVDQRGFSRIVTGPASEFLAPNDTRLLLNTKVTDIKYSDTSVTITNADGSCITADFAICTFSLGVLQTDAVNFTPNLPSWKSDGIYSMQMGTYTKIFLQFPPSQQFWHDNTQFFLYADPVARGYYPIFQSLSASGFLQGSGILFVTVVNEQSYIVEAQSDAQTKAQIMAVLRAMIPHKTIPDPIDFMYPRWSLEPWAYGSYSNWPPSMSLQNHQNLRANVGRLWFAGEHTSTQYFGFLQGSYFEGQATGKQIATCLKGNVASCLGQVHYERLTGVTDLLQYTNLNGWLVPSFQTAGKEYCV